MMLRWNILMKWNNMNKKEEATYDDFIWYIKLGIELGIIDKNKLKIKITIK